MKWQALKTKSQAWYSRFGPPLACVYAATLPASLTLSYVSFFPLMLLWLLGSDHSFSSQWKAAAWLTVPFSFFCGAYFLGAPFGVDAIRSLRAIPPTLFFFLSVLAIADITKKSGSIFVVMAFLFGQTFSSLHSVLDPAFPGLLPKLFLGPVTESGQLALSLIITLGLAWSLARVQREQPGSYSITALTVWGTINIALFATLAFSRQTHMPDWAMILLTLLSTISVILALVIANRSSSVAPIPQCNALWSPRALTLLLTLCLPLLSAALLINLKRGPWAGVLVGLCIFLLWYRRKLILPLILLAGVVYLSFQPIQKRLSESLEHFFIVGGRSEMWDIGVELATRYPLGVGLRNSRFLQQFSPDIPPEMTHFHNNYINILAEGGWLALGFFLWWVGSLIAAAWSKDFPRHQRPLLIAIGCALISWQIAGLVEYNWGDSEVRMVVFLLAGTLLGLWLRKKTSNALE